MKKFKFFWEFEKEEKWLDEMSEQGYIFERKNGYYFFHKVNPVKTITRIDYRKFSNGQDFIEYKTMFEDSGWEHISGTKSSGTQYFRKTDDFSDNHIFSDIRSRAGRYKRISNMWLEFVLLFTTLFIVLDSRDMVSIQTLLTPKDWYLTPGLWELEGLSFIWSFLFETPFALFRGCLGLFYLILILLYSIFAIKSYRVCCLVDN